MDTRPPEYRAYAILHCWNGFAHRFGDRRLPSKCSLSSHLVLSTYCVRLAVAVEAHEDFVRYAQGAH